MERLFKNISNRQTIAKNIFWLFVTHGLNKVLRLGVVFLAARALTPSGYGSFSYALATATLAFVFADWGVDLLVSREYMRHSNKAKFIRTAFSLKTILVLGFGMLGAIGYWIIDEPGAKSVYLLLIALMVVTQLRDFFIYILRAEERMEKEFVLVTIESVITLVAVIGIAWWVPTVPALGAAYLVGMLMSLGGGILLTRKSFQGRLLSWDTPIALWLVRHGWSLALFGVLTSVFFSVDQIMLGRVRPTAEVGLYALATKAVTLTLLVPQVIMGALFPHLTRTTADTPTNKKRALQATGLMALIGIGIAGTIQLIAPWIVTILGGPEYAAAIPILRNLVWIIVMIFPVTFLDYWLIARGHQVADLLATGVAAGINIILALWLIPSYGVSGAIWATTISQGLNLVFTGALALYILQRKSSQPTHA